MRLSTNVSSRRRRSPVLRVAAPQVLAVSGGKGGIGKTSIAVNLAVALAASGRDTMVLDGDLALSNVNVALGQAELGVETPMNLADYVFGDANIDDLVVRGPHGIRIISGASGNGGMGALNEAEVASIVHAVSHLEPAPEVLVVDSQSGLSVTSLGLSAAAQDLLVVLCDEPAAITDAYACIKCMRTEHGCKRFHIVTNMVDDARHARSLFLKLANVTDRFLNVSLNHLGSIPMDPTMRSAIQARQPVLQLFPESPAAAAFDALGRAVTQLPQSALPSGRLEFFVERLLGRGSASLEVPA